MLNTFHKIFLIYRMMDSIFPNLRQRFHFMFNISLFRYSPNVWSVCECCVCVCAELAQAKPIKNRLTWFAACVHHTHRHTSPASCDQRWRSTIALPGITKQTSNQCSSFLCAYLYLYFPLRARSKSKVGSGCVVSIDCCFPLCSKINKINKENQPDKLHHSVKCITLLAHRRNHSSLFFHRASPKPANIATKWYKEKPSDVIDVCVCVFVQCRYLSSGPHHSLG